MAGGLEQHPIKWNHLIGNRSKSCFAENETAGRNAFQMLSIATGGSK
jgi:hypothetical protein